MSNPLIIPATSSGSGVGISYYSDACRCPRYAALKKARGDGEVTGPSTFARDVGTCFHKLMEFYHGGRPGDVQYIDVEDPAMRPALTEARRLFQVYARKYHPTFFGTLVGTEISLPGDHAHGCEALASTPGACNCARARNAGLLLDALGTEVTGRIDRATIVEPGCGAWPIVEGAGGKAGLYLADYKVKFRLPGNWESMCLHSLQAKTYMVMWNILNPGHQVQGFLFQTIRKLAKTLPEHFFVTYVPPPTEEDTLVVATFLANAAALAATEAPLASSCFDKGTCPFLSNGQCNRR